MRPRPPAPRACRALVLVLAACGADEAPPASAAPAAPVEPGAPLIRLARASEDVALVLPPSNLPPGRNAGLATLREPFVKARTVDGVDVWTTRPPFLEPSGADGALSLSGPGGRLPRSAEVRAGTWDLVGGLLEVRTPAGAHAPLPKAHRLRSDAVASLEASLSLDTSGLDPAAFAFRRLGTSDCQVDGVYLPAPASATWTLNVPAGARFSAEVRLVPPPIEGAGSDGATVVLEVVRDEGVVEVARVEAVRGGALLEATLDGFVGPTKLRLRTDPGATRFYDFVQVVDPVVVVAEPAPTRVVVVDVSGLRRADLAAATGPLAAFAASAVAFDQAWTVAPWTLPAVRAVLSGAQPERFEERPALPERLSAAGFASAAFFDDPTLLGPDGAARGWTVARVLRDPAAFATAAEVFFTRSAGRDAVLFLQLGELERSVPAAGPGALEPWLPPLSGKAPTRAEVLARVGATLDAVLAAAGPSAWVLVFADHGLVLEAGGARHADTLADDVVHVPLLVRGPGTKPGRRDVPVSLLDVTPTVLQVVGQVPPVDVAGRSLATLLTDPPGDAAPLLGRALVFGRARGDASAWGVVDAGVAWRTGDPVPAGANPERRLDQALGAGIRTPATAEAE